MDDQDIQNPREDDRNDEIQESPAPDPEATPDPNAADDPEAD